MAKKKKVSEVQGMVNKIQKMIKGENTNIVLSALTVVLMKIIETHCEKPRLTYLRVGKICLEKSKEHKNADRSSIDLG